MNGRELRSWIKQLALRLQLNQSDLQVPLLPFLTTRALPRLLYALNLILKSSLLLLPDTYSCTQLTNIDVMIDESLVTYYYYVCR
jgi:hypothetical protein